MIIHKYKLVVGSGGEFESEIIRLLKKGWEFRGQLYVIQHELYSPNLKNEFIQEMILTRDNFLANRGE